MIKQYNNNQTVRYASIRHYKIKWIKVGCLYRYLQNPLDQLIVGIVLCKEINNYYISHYCSSEAWHHKTDGNSFCGDVVLHSVNLWSRDDDNILDREIQFKSGNYLMIFMIKEIIYFTYYNSYQIQCEAIRWEQF